MTGFDEEFAHLQKVRAHLCVNRKILNATAADEVAEKILAAAKKEVSAIAGAFQPFAGQSFLFA